MSRLAIITRIEWVRSSLDGGESPRKIIDGLVHDYGATCVWDGGQWTLAMLGVITAGSAPNAALLCRWCDKAASQAARPLLSDLAPLDRPAFLCGQISAALSRLAPTSLLVSATWMWKRLGCTMRRASASACWAMKS